LYLLEIKMADIEQMQKKGQNPLTHWFRQPKIYIRLPSNGEFYPPGALDISANGDYPVYAMTAKDELMFKTPDALLSGQSTVEVIKSCIPAILNPWQMPSIDVDAVLIAIRVATYGEKMDVTANCVSCNEENSYDVNLVQRLEELSQFKYHSVVDCDPLVVHIRPYTYQELTKTSIKTFEQQRIFNIVNDDQMSDEEKMKKFGESFIKLTELTVEVIAGCITKIDTPDGSVTDTQFIREFIDNAQKDVFEKISQHVQNLKKDADMPDVHVKCSACSHEFDMTVSMDQSNFFGVRS
jgi:hypothetical protein